MTQSQKIILIPFLIISLAVFNLPSFLVLAEEDETGSQSTEQSQDEGAGQENDNGQTNDTGDTGQGEAADTGDEGGDDGQATTENEEPEVSYIVTGDGQAETDIENEVNTNVTDLGDSEDPVDPSETEGDLVEEEDSEVLDASPEAACSDNNSVEESNETADQSSEEELAETEEEDCQEDCSEPADSSLEVANDNEAVIENEVEGIADTGTNSSSGNDNHALIDTGDAEAGANLSNVVNTNLIGSNFWFYLSNLFNDLVGDVHFNNFSSNQTNDCGLIDCLNPLEVSNNNIGSIVNQVEVYALTGDNSADENWGHGLINTGNARAVVNVANLLNTNIVGSDWLFSILNNFGDWQGNLVFPGEEAIGGIINGQDSPGNQISVENTDEAIVENNVETLADTGNNSANGNYGGSIIETGQAEAEANISTMANTNIFGSNWLMVAVKVLGDWGGQLFESSLPEGVSWLRTPDGIIIFNTNWGEALTDLGQEAGLSEGGNNSLEVTNNNFGEIINNLEVVASSGGNSASYNGGSGLITTGNASVTANIANFVNTNIIGRNWLLGLINIFGDWQGNLAFGQPDLWVGASALPLPNPPHPGGLIDYTLSYFNNGDAQATEVTVVVDYNHNPICQDCLMVEEVGSGNTSVPGQISWQIDSVPVGGSGSIDYTLTVNPNISFGEWFLTNSASIDSFEDDANDQDNTDILSLLVKVINRPLPTVGSDNSQGSGSGQDGLPLLKITKTNDVEDSVYSDELINYKIVLTNEGEGSAYDVVVTDNFTYATSSQIIRTEIWELGEVFSDEEIIIDYSLIINGQALAGTYTNTAQADGFDIYDQAVSSNQASSTVELLIREEIAGGDDQSGQEDSVEEEAADQEEASEALSEEETEEVSLREEMDSQLGEMVEEINFSILGLGQASAGFCQTDQCEAGSEEPEESVKGLKGFDKRFLAGMANLLQNGSLTYFLFSLLGLFILALLILLYLRHRQQGE